MTTLDRAQLKADVLWLCVPDAAIERVTGRMVKRVGKRGLKGQIVVHSSGADAASLTGLTAFTANNLIACYVEQDGKAWWTADPVAKLPQSLRDKPSVVRIAYTPGAADRKLIGRRKHALIEQIRAQWEKLHCCYQLQVEDETTEAPKQRRPRLKGGIQVVGGATFGSACFVIHEPFRRGGVRDTLRAV